MMEETFRPCGGVGTIKADTKHIEFFNEDNFEKNFEQLITAINGIRAGTDLPSGK
jgi:hypothetical protein